MKRMLGLLLFMTIIVSGSAQLSHTEQLYMRNELMSQLNELRSDLGLHEVRNDLYLHRAASSHSTYMARRRRLSHRQAQRATKSVLKRVQHSGGMDFKLVGENILYFGPVKEEFAKKDLDQMAQRMFDMWKGSKGHYKNMVHPDFSYCDFGFKIDTRNNIIYATQVLGSR